MMYSDVASYMTHVFNAERAEMLIGKERRERQPPETILDRLGAETGEVWLDLGAGNGFITLPLLQNGCQVVALDLQPEMLDMLRARVPEELRPHLTAVQSALPAIPLEDSFADHIVLVNVFHEIPQIPEAIQEIFRVLKDGGTVHVIDHQKVASETGPPLEDRISPLEVCGHFGRDPIRTYQDPMYYHLVFKK